MKKYDKYKSTNIEWLPQIPAHWEMSKAKYYFKYTTGFTPPTGQDEFYNGAITWVTIADMKQKIVSESVNTLSKNAIDKYKPDLSTKGSLLFSFKLSVGKVAFAGKDLYTNEAIISILPDVSYDVRYFYYTLPEQLLQSANENIYGAKMLNQELIRNAPICFPPKKEQIAISNFLDEKTKQIDDLIFNKRKLIQLLKEERTGIINDAVTKGVNKQIKLKPSGIELIKDIPQHWEIKKLKYLVSKIGSGVTPNGGASVYLQEGIPLLRSQNIYSEGLVLDDVAFISEEMDEQMSNSRINEDDVLLNITGASIGRCYFVPQKFGRGNVNQHVCIIRTIQSKLKTKYLYSFLISGYGQTLIEACQNGANREGLNFQQIKSFDIPLPKIEEQEVIIKYIENETQKIDLTINEIEKEIELMQEYRITIISEVVTGKIKVIA